MLLRLFTVCLFLLTIDAQGAAKSGVVLLTVDGMGWGDLSASGDVHAPMPHIDKLLAESAVFLDFHVTPLDGPSRAALLGGLYPERAGVWGCHSGRNLLRPGLLTIASHLRAAGYVTGLFGTWALGDVPPCRAQDHGYSHVLTHPGGAPGGVSDFYSNDGTDDLWLVNGEVTALAGSWTEVCFGRALHFIEKNLAQPFFCHIAPSMPAGIPDAKVQPFRDRKEIVNPLRAAWMAELDECVGNLMGHLERMGIAGNTIVLITSTSGMHKAAGEHGKHGLNAGRRGERGSPYEGGHCVPLLVRWPGGAVAAGKIAFTAAHMDLLPTIAELTAAPLPAGFKPDGLSLVPFLHGAMPGLPPERIIITDAQEIPVPVMWRQSCVMAGPWRLVNGRELYDLRVDPGQRKNAAADNTATVKRLRAAYESWWQNLDPSSLQPVRMIVGGPQDPVLLTANEWLARASAPMTRSDVMRGTPANGQWMLEVAEQGKYDILLRRWPLNVERPIHEAFLAPQKARLRIGSLDESQPVPPGAAGINFRVQLKPGPVSLQTWFIADDGQTGGAYFVEVRRAVEVRAAKPVPQPKNKP